MEIIAGRFSGRKDLFLGRYFAGRVHRESWRDDPILTVQYGQNEVPLGRRRGEVPPREMAR